MVGRGDWEGTAAGLGRQRIRAQKTIGCKTQMTYRSDVGDNRQTQQTTDAQVGKAGMHGDCVGIKEHSRQRRLGRYISWLRQAQYKGLEDYMILCIDTGDCVAIEHCSRQRRLGRYSSWLIGRHSVRAQKTIGCKKQMTQLQIR